MRIAYLHYLCDDSSALNHVRAFVKAARALGHEVDVHALNVSATGRAGGGDAVGPPSRDPWLKKHLRRYLHEPKQLLWNTRYTRRALELLRADRPDVILARHDGLNASYAMVARRLKLPLVVEINAPVSEWRLYTDQYLHLPLVSQSVERWTLRRADAMTTVSTALKDHLVDRHALAADRIHVAPNGADIEVFHPGVAPDAELPLEFREGTVVGFVGSFLRFHGLELLSRMTVAVGEARPEARFLFVGDGPGLESVRARTAPLGERALFLGRVPPARVPGLVAAMDIGVLADTNFYSSPLKVMEWMAAGIAVVAPRYGPLEEVIEDGVDGALFEPRDAGELERVVTRLVADAEVRRKLGSSAARRVRDSLTWRHNADRVIGACREAQGRQGASAARGLTEGSASARE
jgi:glycosyltransferase involved in cell wall biosynthesis